MIWQFWLRLNAPGLFGRDCRTAIPFSLTIGNVTTLRSSGLTVVVLGTAVKPDRFDASHWHSKRIFHSVSMPAMLSDRDALEWLSGGGIGHALSLLKPFAADLLDGYEVSKLVNNRTTIHLSALHLSEG